MDERTPAPRTATPPRVSLRLVVMPTEHGGWSFLFEPILLGMLVAPSWAGACVALAAVAGFLARQPLKAFVGDRRRGKVYPRTRVAERAFAVLALVALGAVYLAVQLDPDPVFLWPLAAAVPFGAAALAFDFSKRSREAAGELAGALALGAVATSIAVAGGAPHGRALALWGVLGARTVPTILFVRARVRLERGQRITATWSNVAHVVAIAWVALLAKRGVTPWLAVWAMVLLAIRAAYGLTPWRPRLKTWQLGVTEIVFGLVVVLAAAFGR